MLADLKQSPARVLTAIEIRSGRHQIFAKGPTATRVVRALTRFILDIGNEDGSAEDMRAHFRDALPARQALAMQALAWILTSPGADLPWTDDALVATPPAWTRVLRPHDVATLVSTWVIAMGIDRAELTRPYIRGHETELRHTMSQLGLLPVGHTVQ